MRVEINRDDLVKYVSRWVDASIQTAEDGISDREKRIREAMATITQEWREIKNLRNTIDSLKETSSSLVISFEEELKRMEESWDMERLRISEDHNALVIHTKEIDLAYNGKIYHIGRFWIEIYWTGRIRMENVDNRCKYPIYGHPHIRDSEPCLGNMSGVIGKLIANLSWTPLLGILFDFLHAYHKEDAYCEIENWPSDEKQG